MFDIILVQIIPNKVTSHTSDLVYTFINKVFAFNAVSSDCISQVKLLNQFNNYQSLLFLKLLLQRLILMYFVHNEKVLYRNFRYSTSDSAIETKIQEKNIRIL